MYPLAAISKASFQWELSSKMIKLFNYLLNKYLLNSYHVPPLYNKWVGRTVETVTDFIFLGSKNAVDGDCSHKIKRHLFLGRKAMTNLESILKSRDITLLTKLGIDKARYSQSYGFSSSHVWKWELDYEEGWAPKNWCFQIVGLEKTLENALDCKDFKPVDPKGNQPWIFIGRTGAEAEAPILWPRDVKSRVIGKRPWCWERLKAKEEGGGRGWAGYIASLS